MQSPGRAEEQFLPETLWSYCQSESTIQAKWSHGLTVAKAASYVPSLIVEVTGV